MDVSALVVLVALCALSTAYARRGFVPPSLRVSVGVRVPVGPLLSRPSPLAHQQPVTVKPRPPSVAAAFVVASLLFGLSTSSSTRSPLASVTTPLPPRLSYWDTNGRLQRLEDMSFTREDAREMEAERKEKDRVKEAERNEEDRVKEAERKEENRVMEAERKEENKVMAETMQKNFTISTFLTVVSLFISLAANEGFTAKLLPPK